MTLIQKLRKSKAGFTLIELIVVIAILAILAAVLVPAMISYLAKAKAQKEESNLRSAYSSACAAYTSIATQANPDFTKLGTETKTLLGGTSTVTAGTTAGSNQADNNYYVQYDANNGVVAIYGHCDKGGYISFNGSKFTMGASSEHKH